MGVNVENMKKWVAALRSGKYAQTESRLADITGYCCLGVACEVAIENGAPIRKEIAEWGAITYNGAQHMLPGEAQKWLGVSDEDIKVEFEDEFEDDGEPITSTSISGLAELNDSGKSFEWIADRIEENFIKGA